MRGLRYRRRYIHTEVCWRSAGFFSRLRRPSSKLGKTARRKPQATVVERNACKQAMDIKALVRLSTCSKLNVKRPACRRESKACSKSRVRCISVTNPQSVGRVEDAYAD